MAANISTYNFEQLTDLITRSFQEKLKNEVPVMRTAPFVVNSPLPMHTGKYKRFSERITREKFARRREEGADTKVGKVQDGYEKELEVHTIATMIGITKEMRDAGKEQEMLIEISNGLDACINRIEIDLTHRFTFAFDSYYTDLDGVPVDITVGDGLPLISKVHTLTGSGTTYSNEIVGNPQFSKGALEGAERLFIEQTYDNLGEKKTMKPDMIITTNDPTVCNKVAELLNATADITTSNSGTINVYKTKYKHMAIPNLNTTATGVIDTTKNNMWFLVSSEDSDFYFSELVAPYLKTPGKGNNGEDFSTETWEYLAGAMNGNAIVTGRWIKGSKGNGDA